MHAVFYDFGNERGQIVLDRGTYAAAWGDDRITSLQVRLAAGSDPEAVASAWGGRLRTDYPVVVNSYGHVKTEVMKVFDRDSAGRLLTS